MPKTNLQNERIKRRYFDWLKEAEGLANSTIEKVERSIILWEDFTQMDDFRNFNSTAAKAFKKWLSERKNQNTSQPISLTTRHHYLICLSDFFKWLSGQQGYKSRISTDDIAYLKLDKKETKIALNPTRRRYPTLEIVQKVVQSIQPQNEVDRRDQALIAFTLLSGMRDEAITTLPLGCLNLETLEVHQNPEKGVKTKFSKDILTTLFVFDPKLLRVIQAWVDYLKKDKLFTDQDPLFPATKTEQESSDSYCFTSEKIEQRFWKTTNSIRNIFKRRFEQAGQEYFSPHTFRHLATKLAIDLCSTPAEFKAVSQNLGHENVATTMFDYARLPDDEVSKKVKNITSNKGGENDEDVIKRLLKDYDIKPKI
jgi:integrase/recombinase XerD